MLGVSGGLDLLLFCAFVTWAGQLYYITVYLIPVCARHFHSVNLLKPKTYIMYRQL